MATPDYKTLLKSATTWREEHRGVSIQLSHHGYRDGTEYEGASPEPGTWCYYLLLTEQMFRPEDWAKLVCAERETDWGRTYDYENFPDVDFHGGITFYEINIGWDKHQKRKVQTIKAGCDYNHSWDCDGGYWHNYDAVLGDAKASVDSLIEQFPGRLERCGYCGLWDEPSEFYTARNGRRIHKSQQAEFSEERWAMWLPEQESA